MKEQIAWSVDEYDKLSRFIQRTTETLKSLQQENWGEDLDASDWISTVNEHDMGKGRSKEFAAHQQQRNLVPKPARSFASNSDIASQKEVIKRDLDALMRKILCAQTDIDKIDILSSFIKEKQKHLDEMRPYSDDKKGFDIDPKIQRIE